MTLWSINRFFKMGTAPSLLTGLFLFCSSVFGADGSSGCGPGWYILKDNSLVSSSLRATTNGALFPVYTIGMTVGTSNCTKHSIVLNEKKSLHLLTMSYFEIKADIARGAGNYLHSFGTTLGCSEQAVPELSQTLKNNYQRLYPSSSRNPGETLLEVYKSILQKPSLAQQCSFSVG